MISVASKIWEKRSSSSYFFNSLHNNNQASKKIEKKVMWPFHKSVTTLRSSTKQNFTVITALCQFQGCFEIKNVNNNMESKFKLCLCSIEIFEYFLNDNCQVSKKIEKNKPCEPGAQSTYNFKIKHSIFGFLKQRNKFCSQQPKTFFVSTWSVISHQAQLHGSFVCNNA